MNTKIGVAKTLVSLLCSLNIHKYHRPISWDSLSDYQRKLSLHHNRLSLKDWQNCAYRNPPRRPGYTALGKHHLSLNLEVRAPSEIACIAQRDVEMSL